MSDRCRRNDRRRRSDGSRLDGRGWRDDGRWCGDGRWRGDGSRSDDRRWRGDRRRSDDRLRCDDGCGNGYGGSNDYRCGDGGRSGDRGRCWRGDGLDGQGRCLGKRRGLKCLSGFSLQAVAGCGRILLCQVASRWCVVVGASTAAACAQQQGRESKGQGLGNVRSAHGREVRKEWRRRIVDRCRAFRSVIRDGEMLLPGRSAAVEGDAPVLQLSLATLHAVGRHQFPVPAVAAGHRFFQMAANAKGEVAQAAATFHQ